MRKPRKTKFELYQTTCKRCGCTLYTGSRSLFGNDDLKKRLERLCDGCITAEEKELLRSYRPIVKA